jgi:hypothetical protein
METRPQDCHVVVYSTVLALVLLEQPTDNASTQVLFLPPSFPSTSKSSLLLLLLLLLYKEITFIIQPSSVAHHLPSPPIQLDLLRNRT